MGLKILSFVSLIVLLYSSFIYAEDVKGKVILTRGDEVTISMEGSAPVIIGDSVELSYSIAGEVIGVGTWKVSAVKSGSMIEAVPDDILVDPQLNFDALIHATGVDLIKESTAQVKVEPPAMTADERFELALKLYEGKDIPMDRKEAIRLLELGVAEKHPASMRGYGWLYENGADGFPKDDYRAFELYKAGADGGDESSYKLLAVLYWEGRGVEKSEGLAAHYFDKACSIGNAYSCGQLGYMYENGRGLQLNVSRAMPLYEKGCELENEWSCDQVERFRRQAEEARVREQDRQRDQQNRDAAKKLLPGLLDFQRQLIENLN